jgi:glc operon protein GlcG
MNVRIGAIGALVALTLAASAAQAQVPGPSLADAKKAIAAAQATATTLKTNLSCVVLDSRGAIVLAERMDKANFFTVDIARGKALVSASFGSPSGALAQLASSGIGNVLPGPGAPVFLQGAVPLKGGGAIGCSGGSGQQDEDGAKAGAAAIGN